MILGVLAYIFIIYGFASFFKRIVGLYAKVTWLAACALIVLVLYIAAYVQLLTPASYSLMILGAGYGLWSIYQNIKSKAYLNWRFTVLGVWISFFSAIFINILMKIHMTHYDNYSHWALIVKFLFTEDRLPTANDTIIAYTSYPMGSSLLVYFATKVAGFNAIS